MLIIPLFNKGTVQILLSKRTIHSITGEWFCPRCGVHQGAPLSMILYTISINPLLSELSQNPYGLCVANLTLSSPAHANDVALLTHYKVGLNFMFATAVVYGFTSY